VRAVQITEFGGPEVLRLAEVPDPVPAEGQSLLRVRSAGINFADSLQAEDAYLAPQHLPLVPGSEVVGTDDQGRRVVALTGGGGYAELALAAPGASFELPEGVDDGAALALVLQGTTAWHLLRTSAHLQAGDSVVVVSGAGGVGSLAVQLARHWGAGRVIATASSADKRALVRELGADAAVDVSGLDADGVAAALREANEGRGVDVVLEMTGGAVFDGSLAALEPFGRLVTYGAASQRPGSPVDPGALLGRSASVTGFWLAQLLGRSPHALGGAVEELLSLTTSGVLRPVVGGHYPLAEAARAHADLRARRTTGKLVLDVDA
jgi:NADPH:quinone reductase-like Zn-dependent oxidoreductase